MNDGATWQYPLTDALGSVRGYVGTNTAVLSNVNYSPIGVPDTAIIGPAFTGEWRSENETQYHRARHLSPGLGVWLSLDPFEGVVDRPMSLNGYSWVEGNVINKTDASGMCVDDWICRELRNTNPDTYLQLCPGAYEETLITPNGFVPLISPAVREAIARVEGSCDSRSASDRSACALQTLDALLDRFGIVAGGIRRLRWKDLIAVVMHGEGGNLYNLNWDNADRRSDYQAGQPYFRCHDNMGRRMSDCNTFRLAFENQVVRNLRGNCNGSNILGSLTSTRKTVPPEMQREFTAGNRCSGAEVLFWLAGVPGEAEGTARISGVEAIYGAANPINEDRFGCDPSQDTRCGPVNFNKLIGAAQSPSSTYSGLSAANFEAKAINAINRTNGESCNNCVWGNMHEAPTGQYYAFFFPEPLYGSYFVLQGDISLSQ